MSKARVSPEQLFTWIESYINHHQYAPSVREMAKALGYRSPSPVQRQLDILRDRGWLTWIPKKARSYQILKPSQVTAIKGVISAHSLMEVFPDEVIDESFDLFQLLKHSKWSQHDISQFFALRVRGDSMIGAMIADQDVVILTLPDDTNRIKNGTIVAARVENKTTLKYYHIADEVVTLKPANPNYHPTSVAATRVDIQGVYVGVLRGLI
ncbi:MAG: repressor LexA [Cyanothece sp. SIO2G6]|nr:repressor LexA [Cyanothece sp. SIO2G6]